MKKSIIVSAKRCLFFSGHHILMGYNAKGEEVFGIPCRPRNGYKWLRGNCSADLKRIQKAYEEEAKR
jgi:hypothetical protein